MNDIRTIAERLITLAGKATPGKRRVSDRHETTLLGPNDEDGDHLVLAEFHPMPHGLNHELESEHATPTRTGAKANLALAIAADPQTITRLAKALIAALDVIDIVRHDYSAIEIVDAVNAFDLATAEKQS